jgi:hypothetical protein
MGYRRGQGSLRTDDQSTGPVQQTTVKPSGVTVRMLQYVCLHNGKPHISRSEQATILESTCVH